MTGLPLYPSEAAIADAVLGPGRRDEWTGLVQVLEGEGFPPIQPRFGGRHWESCLHWFRIKNGLSNVEAVGFAEDGGETCPEPKKRRQDLSGAPVATVHKLPTGSPRQPR